MAENYDDISCEDVIYSEDYRDYIKEYFQDFSSIAGTYHPVCIEAVSYTHLDVYKRQLLWFQTPEGDAQRAG